MRENQTFILNNILRENPYGYFSDIVATKINQDYWIVTTKLNPTLSKLDLKYETSRL